ncbi:MAG: uracil-DNA glycosylase [Candidatus Hodarchaeales archaeon]|jgi:DNA polymerase
MLEPFRSTEPDCTACPLSQSRSQVVYPDILNNSSDKLKTLVIGEAPGATEDRKGKPFIGQSGKILRNKLKILPGSVIITNIVKCKPPKNRDPHVNEKKACKPFLLKEIAFFDPQFLILVGRHAATSLLGVDQVKKFTESSGQVFKDKYIPIIHPAATFYNSVKNKPIWESSWQKIQDIIQKRYPKAKFSKPPKKSSLQKFL